MEENNSSCDAMTSLIPGKNFRTALKARSNHIEKAGQMQNLSERIYNPITAMGFSAMFTFQLDNTKR